MVDISAISAALSSIKMMGDIGRSLIDTHDQTAFQAKLIEFNTQLIAAQNSVLLANEERTALIAENAKLKAEQAKAENWEAEKARYTLTKASNAGTFVYRLKPAVGSFEPLHEICANCYESGKKAILQTSDKHSLGRRVLRCDRCKAEVMVDLF